MVIKDTSTLMAFEEDIRNRGFIDWLVAHTGFAKPLHRYEGKLSLMNDRLVFYGNDKKKKQRYHLQIKKKMLQTYFMDLTIFSKEEKTELWELVSNH